MTQTEQSPVEWAGPPEWAVQRGAALAWLGRHAGRLADQVDSAYVGLQGVVELHLGPHHAPLLEQLKLIAQAEQVETCEHHGRSWHARTYTLASGLTIRTVRSQPIPGVVP